jgi:hypothetical protein
VVGSKSFGGQPVLVVWRLSVWVGKCGRLKQVVKNSVCGLGGRETLICVNFVKEESVLGIGL